MDTDMPDLAFEPQRIGAVEDAQLALPEPETELMWRQLPREALLSEVAKYRNAIRDLAGRLRGLGDQGLPTADHLLVLGQDAASAAPYASAVTAAGAAASEPLAAPDPDSVPAGAPGQDPDESELLQLGEEGLDYTFGSVDDVDPSEWQVPPHCVPIHANVTTFDWPRLYEHCQFDVIMMDPPWQLATANPTRGVALGYSQLSDDHISGLPVPQLQREGGFLFVWVINAKYKWTLDLFDKWGYRLVDEVVWVKMTVNRRLAKSHGYYLQHAKEVCLVAKRGNPPARVSAEGVGSDIIFSERRGQSQKPEEIYELIEQLVPNGRYLEIFARKNNLRDFWVSIGNEVTGTGLPEDDLRALKELNCIPGAVYGKTGGSAGTAGGSNRAPSGGSGPVSDAAVFAGGGGSRASGGGGSAVGRGPAASSRAGPGSRASTPGPSAAPARAASPAASGAGTSGAGAAAPTTSQGAVSMGAPGPAAAHGSRADGTAQKQQQQTQQACSTKLKLRIRRPEQQQQPAQQPLLPQAEQGPEQQALPVPDGGKLSNLQPCAGPLDSLTREASEGGPAGRMSLGGVSGLGGSALRLEDPFGAEDMQVGLVEGDSWDTGDA